jgi:hypothetical protein
MKINIERQQHGPCFPIEMFLIFFFKIINSGCWEDNSIRELDYINKIDKSTSSARIHSPITKEEIENELKN